MDKITTQIQATENRYHKRKKQRNNTEKVLKKREQGLAYDWKELDQADRLVQRYRSLEKLEPVPSIAATVLREVIVDHVEFNPLERILETNELQSISFLLRGTAVSRCVGRVLIRSSTGIHLGSGTGFMISPRLLMTNNHVLETANTARNSSIEFNYYEKFDGTKTVPIEHTLDPDLFFVTDEDLDFSIVAVQSINAQNHEVKNRGWTPLIKESGKAVVGERVNIIQHPSGEPQQISVRANQILDVVEDFLHYKTDTERGSSGSPVFNDHWELAALHHSGVPARDDEDNILLINGDKWDGSNFTMDKIKWEANEGVRISKIVEHMDQQSLSTDQSTLFEQSFVSPEPTIEESLLNDVIGGNGTRQRNTSSSDRKKEEIDFTDHDSMTLSGPVIDASGNAVWTIPVELKLGVANLVSGTIATPSPPKEKPLSAPSADVINISDSDLGMSLNSINEHENQAYYDKDKDQEAASEYYAQIDSTHRPKTLFKHLNSLLRDTHQETLSYKTARLKYLYPWVDLHEDRKLKSIYSGHPFSPEEIIRADLEIEAMREVRTREFFARESNITEENLQELLDTLESSMPFNCEHVVPQSWFQKKQPMKADLHHLFACESPCNSFRSNIPYYEFSPTEEVFRDDCGQREESKFEPVAGKGVASRATLYFLMRYPGMIGDAARELQEERLGILLKWHNDEPVSKYERHRNQAIYQIQGNRNPLIDNPDWSDLIDFKSGFGI